MRVFKQGNGMAVRLPAEVVEELGLRPGDDIDIHVAGRQRVVIRHAASADDDRLRLRPYRGRLPADFKFDRQRANER